MSTKKLAYRKHFMESLGERIKFCRKSLRMTQEAFAKALLFESKVVVSNWENNNRTPEVSTLINIAKLSNCTLDWLLLGKGSISLPEQEESQMPEKLEGLQKIYRVEDALKNYSQSSGTISFDDLNNLIKQISLDINNAASKLKILQKELARDKGKSTSPS